MTLSPATSVGFAVVGGAPSDARQWITVDLAGFPGAGRRGYVIAAEPLERTWHAMELAQRSREIIMTELRRLVHLPADEALGRSFAAANGVVYGKNREAAISGTSEETALIGITAIIFEDQLATMAFVPPGQLILVEDGLVYMVPEFDSWLPDYQQPDTTLNQAEPLGYASWTAPLMAQTEIRPGDSVILCTSETGRAYVEGAVESGHSVNDLTWFHHRDPDHILNSFKDLVIAREIPSASVAVVSFPPLPNNAQIQTIGDVTQRARDSWRHGKAIVRQLKPAKTPKRPPRKRREQLEEAVQVVAQTVEIGYPAPAPRPQPRTNRGLDRLQRVFEPGPDSRANWRKPNETSEFGVTSAHGVNVFRGQSHYMGDASWRHNLPRLPIIGSAWIWPLMVMILIGMVLGSVWVRQEYFTPHINVEETIVTIDQHIVAAQNSNSEDTIVSELTAAQNAIDQARETGVAPETLDPRQQAVTELLDEATNVLRMSDLQRIGSLPEEFSGSNVQGVYTPAGVFFVAGSLYQYRPSQQGATPELVKILVQGDDVSGVNVGSLWGLAFDAKGLYVTDGEYAYMLPVESQEWRAVKLGRINNQPWKPGPIAAFDGSIYLLQAEYRQIYRFPIDGTATEAVPRDWLLTGARDLIEYATDIAIDESIYVLMDDGMIQHMYLGDIRSTIEPPYIGEDKAVALVGRGGTGYLYQAVEGAEGSDGRIVAFDINGEHAVQLKLPIGFSPDEANVSSPFKNIQDVIVDESTGTIYIINADAIWTARYSLPELPADPENDQNVPDATPAA